jgi:hypothetical protein
MVAGQRRLSLPRLRVELKSEAIQAASPLQQCSQWEVAGTLMVSLRLQDKAALLARKGRQVQISADAVVVAAVPVGTDLAE